MPEAIESIKPRELTISEQNELALEAINKLSKFMSIEHVEEVIDIIGKVTRNKCEYRLYNLVNSYLMVKKQL